MTTIIRSLTTNEKNLAKSVFGDLIDYSLPKIISKPYLMWQPEKTFIAPNGNIYMNPSDFSEDYASESSCLQGLFIHELAHVLQHQKGTNVLFKGAILQTAYFLSYGIYNPYCYTFIPNKPFSLYNIEQQGEIARDIFFKKIPNIIITSYD